MPAAAPETMASLCNISLERVEIAGPQFLRYTGDFVVTSEPEVVKQWLMEAGLIQEEEQADRAEKTPIHSDRSKSASSRNKKDKGQAYCRLRFLQQTSPSRMKSPQ